MAPMGLFAVFHRELCGAHGIVYGCPGGFSKLELQKFSTISFLNVNFCFQFQCPSNLSDYLRKMFDSFPVTPMWPDSLRVAPMGAPPITLLYYGETGHEPRA